MPGQQGWPPSRRSTRTTCSDALESVAASADIQPVSLTKSRLDRAGWLIFGLIVIPTLSGLVAVMGGVPWQIVFLPPAALLLILVLRKPVVGLYVLFAAALVIPTQPLG